MRATYRTGFTALALQGRRTPILSYTRPCVTDHDNEPPQRVRSAARGQSSASRYQGAHSSSHNGYTELYSLHEDRYLRAGRDLQPGWKPGSRAGYQPI